MQCTLGGPSDNPRTVYRTVLKERGGKFKEMYRGVHLNYTRSVLSWGIGNASYELIRKLLYKIEGTDS
jgi:gamma-glutamylcysteine synthetase